jgi:uncharacterized protein YndB with AHSA1/START domain
MAALGEVRDASGGKVIHFERLYPVGPETVWAALTEPHKLRRWLADAVKFGDGVGDVVDLRFGDAPDQVAQGSILTYDPPRVLEYEWHWPGQTSSSVRFELRVHPGGTLLVVDHHGLPDGSTTAYAAGWHAYLDRLEAQFDGDVPDWQERFLELLPRYRDSSAADGR